MVAAPPPARRTPSTGLIVLLVVLAVIVGIGLGQRQSLEGARSDAGALLAGGDPARAAAVEATVAQHRSVMRIFDWGAPDAAAAAEQSDLLAWAQQLAGTDPAVALALLDGITAPALASQVAGVRSAILVTAARSARQQPLVALAWLQQLAAGNPSAQVSADAAAIRAGVEVPAAAQLVTQQRAAEAVAFLDDAASGGGAAAAQAQAALPGTLLAAAQQAAAQEDFATALADAQRLVAGFGSTGEARTARRLLAAPQAVVGTLMTKAGSPIGGRVRLSSHYSNVGGGYSTSGPFFYGNADSDGDFSISDVAVGGPYVLEVYHGGWTTLIDPKTGQPSSPVTVEPLHAVDLGFIVLPE